MSIAGTTSSPYEHDYLMPELPVMEHPEYPSNDENLKAYVTSDYDTGVHEDRHLSTAHSATEHPVTWLPESHNGVTSYNYRSDVYANEADGSKFAEVDVPALEWHNEDVDGIAVYNNPFSDIDKHVWGAEHLRYGPFLGDSEIMDSLLLGK